MNCGRFCERLFPWVFWHPRSNPTEKFISGTSFQSCCVSHMKIANVHVGTIHQNVRIALQFSYWFAIFISVCNSHFLVYGSYVDVCNFHMGLQFSCEFAIFKSVCNSHLTTTGLLTYTASYGFPCNYELELITPRQPRFSVDKTKKN
jgi:hypothetical protein